MGLDFDLANLVGVVVLGLDFGLYYVEEVEGGHWATVEVEVVGPDFDLNCGEEMD